MCVKNELKHETNKEKRFQLVGKYKQLQNETIEQITREQVNQTESMFNRIVDDKSGKAFWRTKKNLTRDPILDLLTIKNGKGVRQYTPESIKETTAQYYENLYSRKDFPHHPYHDEVINNNKNNVNDRRYDTEWYNDEPSIEEIIEIINNKKNGKSAPDVKNEMLKKTGNWKCSRIMKF